MAIRSSDSRSEKAFYDPFYMAREGSQKNKCDESPCKLFDDFSVANHVHILKPQMDSLNLRSILQSNEKNSELQSRGLVVEKDEEDHRPLNNFNGRLLCSQGFNGCENCPNP